MTFKIVNSFSCLLGWKIIIVLSDEAAIKKPLIGFLTVQPNINLLLPSVSALKKSYLYLNKIKTMILIQA